MTRKEAAPVLRSMTHAPQPEGRLLSSKKNETYSRLLVRILDAIGVIEPSYGSTLTKISPVLQLRDGTDITVTQRDYAVVLDVGKLSYDHVRADATIAVLGYPSSMPGYLITNEPIVTHDDRVFIHSGGSDIYRPASVQDDTILRVVFEDLQEVLAE